MHNSTRIHQTSKKMSMYGLTNHEIASIGTGLENRRVSVGIALNLWRRRFHIAVEEKGFIGEVVADQSNDDCVPKNGGRARKSVEELAGKMELTFLA